MVFDDAEAAPPATAASESTSRTRLIPGRRPSASSIFASPPIPITVPIVSKKSDSITEITIAAAVQKPSELKNPKLNFPTSEKFGEAVRCEKPGHAAEPSASPNASVISRMVRTLGE